MSQFLLGKPTASEIKAAILKCNGIKLDRTQHVDAMKANYHPFCFLFLNSVFLTVKMQLQTMSFKNIVIMVFAEI